MYNLYVCIINKLHSIWDAINSYEKKSQYAMTLTILIVHNQRKVPIYVNINHIKLPKQTFMSCPFRLQADRSVSYH